MCLKKSAIQEAVYASWVFKCNPVLVQPHPFNLKGQKSPGPLNWEHWEQSVGSYPAGAQI